MAKEPVPEGVLEVFEVYKIPQGGRWSNRMTLAVFEDESEAAYYAGSNDAKFGNRYAVYLNGNWFLLASRFGISLRLKTGGGGHSYTIKKRQRELSDKAEALLNLVLLKEHKDEHGKDENYALLQPKVWEQAFQLVGKEYKPITEAKDVG